MKVVELSLMILLGRPRRAKKRLRTFINVREDWSRVGSR
jgi:hypothetical protein